MGEGLQGTRCQGSLAHPHCSGIWQSDNPCSTSAPRQLLRSDLAWDHSIEIYWHVDTGHWAPSSAECIPLVALMGQPQVLVPIPAMGSAARCAKQCCAQQCCAEQSALTSTPLNEDTRKNAIIVTVTH